MEKIKTPFNWVGNKFKFINEINNIVKNKKYNNVIDLFMGSGNIILNIDVESDNLIGNDKIKLLPKIYNTLLKNQYNYEYNDIEEILNRFNRFSKKEDYYEFRDYWNEKYLSNNFDKKFIMETILLLKMCSNSMVRFNPKHGYFNQGFRGLGKKKEFFTEKMKSLCLDEVNNLLNVLNDSYKFINEDFLNIDNLPEGKNLLILDPPYILKKDMYDTDWSKEHDNRLFELMKCKNNDWIYFNYLKRDGIENEELKQFIKENNLSYIEINNKTLAGQGRDKNIKDVSEVIITNIKTLGVAI